MKIEKLNFQNLQHLTEQKMSLILYNNRERMLKMANSMIKKRNTTAKFFYVNQIFGYSSTCNFIQAFTFTK